VKNDLGGSFTFFEKLPPRSFPFLVALLLAARAPASDQVVAPDKTLNGGVAWSSKRLVWSDYRARNPAGADEAAMTALSLAWGFHCTGDVFTFRVAATFFPERSWVDPMIFTQPGSALQTLQHEQLHFDITEVYARRMRQFFATLDRPCSRTEEALTRLAERFISDEADAQRRYDRDTANGRDGAGQNRWNREIGEGLKALASFAVG